MSSSLYRGESRPRRQPPRHHVTLSAATHSTQPVSDPFPPLSNKQFPSLYIRDPVKNQYRRYMRAKTPYKRPR